MPEKTLFINKVKRVLLLICLISCVGLSVKSQNLVFSHLSVENGLSQNAILAIAQDSRGFMWFGTPDGLNRYDGHQFKIYRNSHGDTASLSFDYVNSIFNDSRGNLWIGTDDGLNKYNPTKDGFEHVAGPKNKFLRVKCIYEDKSGALWIGATNGLYKLSDNGLTMTSVLDKIYVLSIYEDEVNNLWIGSDNKGLIKQTLKNGRYQYEWFRHDNNNPASISSNHVRTIAEDKQHNIWVGTSDAGLNLYNKTTRTFSHFLKESAGSPNVTNISIRKIIPDSTGKLWIGTQQGLNIFDPVTKTTNLFQHQPENNKSLSHNSIYSIFFGKHGITWIGTYYGGVNISYRFNTDFEIYKAGKPGQGLNNDVVNSVVEDEKGNLWIGTDGGGLNYFNRKTGVFTYYQNKVNDPKSLSSNMIKIVYRDKKGNIWVGANGGYLNLMNAATGTFTRYSELQLPVEVIAILEDSYGRLWTGSSHDAGILKKNGNSYDPFITPALLPYKAHSHTVKFLFEDKQKNLWVGTSNGLNVIWDKNQKNQLFLKNEKDSTSLKSDNINCIQQDSKGNIWIGTYNGGLSRYNASAQNFTTYTQKDGLPNNTVMGILEDDRGNLWVSTANGLCCFNPAKKTFMTYTYIDGIASNEFNYNSFFKDSKGKMFFGGYNGLTAFYPDNIEANSYPAPVVFTALRLFNQPVDINGSEGLLKEDISLTKEIVFKHDENVFTLEFALLNFEKSNKNKYAYKLDGFEKNWNYVNTPSATYTNLAPGNYTLLVKGANNDGVWSPSLAQLHIKVLPPVWLTWWAYLIYTIIFAAILFFVTRFFFLRELLKKENELHQVKLNFFTNISHEIRTHLTLIMSPLEKIQQAKDDSGFFHDQAKKADSNASRLQKLVSELMDFRKAETNNLVLHIGKYDLIAFLQEIHDSFHELFRTKNISLQFEHDAGVIMLYFDRDQLEKVFFNLLTNAFKFTPANGRVFLIVESENEKIKIKVNDTGQSIAPEHLKNLFNNFFQVADYGTQNTGYGIGLALSKNIIELHKGTITVESAAVTPIKNGENSFTVSLLKGDKHFEKSNHTIEPNPAESVVKEDLVKSMLIPRELSNEINKAENKEAPFTIMTVEDNDELRALIRDTLQGQYHVLECANGVQGLALATEQIPDLIISDVLMPEMDGLTFCHHLKTDERTSHIPVILLTAKSSQADQISGLETGADVYLVKPFSTRALELNVRNLLASRERMREKFRQQLVSLPQEETEITGEEYGLRNVDNSFIEKIMQLIDEHMYDPDFSAGSLSVKAGMNQAILFKKIKAITNMSLNDFIKSHRLKKAAQLLLKGDSRVSDIAFMVGYHDRRYFSREFKKQFGKLPKEYGNRPEDEDE